MQNSGAGGTTSTDSYEFPTPQVVYINGKSCVEQISLPLVQQYYQNLNRPNKDYGFFKLAYFDFPLNDSLTKIIGDDTLINFSVRIYTSEDAESTATTEFIETGPYQTSLYLKDVKNAVDLADRVKDAMTELQIPMLHDYKLALFMQWVTDFTFDPASQKLKVSYEKPALIMNDPYIKRIVLLISGSQTGKAGKLLSHLLGGFMADDGTWYSEFDTGFTHFFTGVIYAHNHAVDAHLYRMYETSAFSINTPQMFIDPYVYIRGTPEASVWTQHGLTTDVIAVQARNRPAGSTATDQAYTADQSHATKTTLASLRNMTLRFTDRDGDLLLLDYDYMIKLMISFNV